MFPQKSQQDLLFSFCATYIRSKDGTTVGQVLTGDVPERRPHPGAGKLPQQRWEEWKGNDLQPPAQEPAPLATDTCPPPKATGTPEAKRRNNGDGDSDQKPNKPRA